MATHPYTDRRKKFSEKQIDRKIRKNNEDEHVEGRNWKKVPFRSASSLYFISSDYDILGMYLTREYMDVKNYMLDIEIDYCETNLVRLNE